MLRNHQKMQNKEHWTNDTKNLNIAEGRRIMFALVKLLRKNKKYNIGGQFEKVEFYEIMKTDADIRQIYKFINFQWKNAAYFKNTNICIQNSHQRGLFTEVYTNVSVNHRYNAAFKKVI